MHVSSTFISLCYFLRFCYFPVFKEREQEGMELVGWQVGKDLRGLWGMETMIILSCMKKSQ